MPSGKGILIVEDDEDIRAAMQMILEFEGHQVCSAANGKLALDFLQNVPSLPSLILLDLMMPVMNGWEFAAALRKEEKLLSIPIVVVSAFPDKVESIQAKAVIKKPVDLAQLRNAVKNYSS